MPYDNTNSGALFKNERKEKENHPDYRGRGNFDGVDFEVAAWIRKSKDGKTYMSLAFSEPYVKEDAPAAAPPRARETQPALDDDIPF